MLETSGAKRNTSKREIMNPEKAVNVIAAAVKEALAIIATAAREAAQLVASDVRDATKLLASNAADAAKVANVKGADDHDLLVELKTKMEGLIADIKEYKNDKADKHDVDDLKTAVYKTIEDRLRKVENKTANYFITISLYSIAIAAMTGLLFYHILHTL